MSKRLARRVVDGAADTGIVAQPVHRDQLTMPARDQKQQKRIGDPVCEAGCQRVPLKMVDADQRQARRRRNPLGAHHAREDAANQSRPGGGGHRIQIGERHVRLGQRGLDAVIQPFDMGARRNLRHHAAERGVQAILPPDH